MTPTAGQIREGVTLAVVAGILYFVGRQMLVQILMLVYSAIAFVIAPGNPFFKYAFGRLAFIGFLAAIAVIATVVRCVVNIVSCAGRKQSRI